MTPIDRFERQLPAALTDLAEPRTPDYVIDILGQTARTSQRPAWASIERWLPLSSSTTRSAGRASTRRLALIAIVAAVALVAIALLATSGGRQTPLPGIVALPSGAPSAAASPTQAAPGPVPAALIGQWVAPLRPVAGLAQSATSAIDFPDTKADPQAPGFNIELGGQSFGQEARADEVEPGILRFVSRSSPGGCQDKDVGRYRWSMPSADALTLELVNDQCAARSAIAPGTWIRSGLGSGEGGKRLAADFMPFFDFTLPDGSWHGLGNMNDTFWLSAPDGSSFKGWKDPDGFSDPCDPASRIDLDPGAAAFLAHLASRSGLTLGSRSEVTVDGRPATRVDVTADQALSSGYCADGVALLAVPHGWADGGSDLALGSSATLVVADIDGATVVFAVQDGSASGDLAASIIGSIHLLDALPAPAS